MDAIVQSLVQNKLNSRANIIAPEVVQIKEFMELLKQALPCQPIHETPTNVLMHVWVPFNIQAFMKQVEYKGSSSSTTAINSKSSSYVIGSSLKQSVSVNQHFSMSAGDLVMTGKSTVLYCCLCGRRYN